MREKLLPSQHQVTLPDKTSTLVLSGKQRSFLDPLITLYEYNPDASLRLGVLARTAYGGEIASGELPYALAKRYATLSRSEINQLLPRCWTIERRKKSRKEDVRYRLRYNDTQQRTDTSTALVPRINAFPLAQIPHPVGSLVPKEQTSQQRYAMATYMIKHTSHAPAYSHQKERNEKIREKHPALPEWEIAIDQQALRRTTLAILSRLLYETENPHTDLRDRHRRLNLTKVYNQQLRSGFSNEITTGALTKALVNDLVEIIEKRKQLFGKGKSGQIVALLLQLNKKGLSPSNVLSYIRNYDYKDDEAA